MQCETILSVFLAVTNSIYLCSPQIFSSLEDDETILLAKHAEDGISMEAFLSDSHYNTSLNTKNIGELFKRKANYKSRLLKEVYQNPPDTITLRFLNLYGDVLFWIKFENPAVLSGFRIRSNRFTSSHYIDQWSYRMLHNSFYWKQGQDRHGTWFAIFEGFDVMNKTNYPKFLFSQSKSKPSKLVTDPFVYSECYNITDSKPSRENVSLHNCHIQCQSRNIVHMAIGRNTACHCGQFHRYTLVSSTLCPSCQYFPLLRCPTAQHIFAGYFLQGANIEASIAHNYTYYTKEIIVSQEITILTAADFNPVLRVQPLYIIKRVITKTPTSDGSKLNLYYSPWPNCSHFIEITETRGFPDVIPMYCLRLSHTRVVPFKMNISVPIVTGGHYISAPSMVITGRWNQESTTKRTTSSGTSSYLTTGDTTSNRDSINMSPTNLTNKLVNRTTATPLSLSTIAEFLTKIATGSSTKDDLTSRNPNVLLNNRTSSAKTVTHNAPPVRTTTLTSSTAQSISGKISQNTRSSFTKGTVVTNVTSTTAETVTIQTNRKAIYTLSTQRRHNWPSPTQNVKINTVCADKTTKMAVNCKPCTWDNVNKSAYVTVKDIEDLLLEIKEKLLLPKRNLNSYTRRLRSAEDNRRSAVGMGYVGMAVIVSCVLWIISTDVTNMVIFVIWMIRKHCARDADLVRLN